MRPLLASLALFALVLAACQPAPPDPDGTAPTATGGDTTGARTEAGPVELRTDRDRYLPGDSVGLTLVNSGSVTYSFNPCVRTVEREDGGWVPVEEPERVCTMEAWLIEAGATSEAHTELPDTLAAGRYRLVIVMTPELPEPPDAVTQAVSAPFTVGS